MPIKRPTKTPVVTIRTASDKVTRQPLHWEQMAPRGVRCPSWPIAIVLDLLPQCKGDVHMAVFSDFVIIPEWEIIA
jgi:hypothetical protein